ncbi:DUF3800 domain-containing protein [Candidatus Poribacteria bacterium]|nr:DUF3800 domain-containing protein [Candidatus Poribacteria bacterium]MYA55893.1 DUF3800 domain-containing protein [Candidatus Poribacteria bacterium]
MRNKKVAKGAPSIRHYFVDEGGDGILFSRKGEIRVGTEGCSRFFILGLLDVSDPSVLKERFDELRARLMRDPYFRGVPSMQPDERKTAVAFHAKDDLPEVRRDVFRILRDTEGLRFFAVVADKLSVLEYVRQRNKREPDYGYHPNELYDYLAECLLKERLGQHSSYNIIFSKHGKSDRLDVLQNLVETASERPSQQQNISTDSVPYVSAATPTEHAGLQAVDYFVWALQRLCERDEERYLAYLWKAFRLIHDIDDTRETINGIYYTQRNPLTAETLRWRK